MEPAGSMLLYTGSLRHAQRGPDPNIRRVRRPPVSREMPQCPPPHQSMPSCTRSCSPAGNAPDIDDTTSNLRHCMPHRAARAQTLAAIHRSCNPLLHPMVAAPPHSHSLLPLHALRLTRVRARCMHMLRVPPHTPVMCGPNGAAPCSSACLHPCSSTPPPLPNLITQAPLLQLP